MEKGGGEELHTDNQERRIKEIGLPVRGLRLFGLRNGKGLPGLA